MAVPTSDDTMSAPTQGIMDPPSSAQREGRLGFLDLPPEIRNRIYGYLFSNNTIHIDGNIIFPGRKFELRISLCTAPTEDHANVSRLTGAAHDAVKEEDARKRAEDAAKPQQSGLHVVPIPVQSEQENRREVCNSLRDWILKPDSGCQQSVQLSTQMLRTCRQVHLDAALLPYSTNTFHFPPDRGYPDGFCDAFAQKLSLKQRRAIQSAIVEWETVQCVEKIPAMLPGLKHLWLKSSAVCWRLDLEEKYARVQLPSLVGVAVQISKRFNLPRLGESDPPHWDRRCEDLEWALLNKEDREDLGSCMTASRAKWDSGERTTG